MRNCTPSSLPSPGSPVPKDHIFCPVPLNKSFKVWGMNSVQGYQHLVYWQGILRKKTQVIKLEEEYL